MKVETTRSDCIAARKSNFCDSNAGNQWAKDVNGCTHFADEFVICAMGWHFWDIDRDCAIAAGFIVENNGASKARE